MLFAVNEFYLTLLAESVRISNLCVYSKNEPKILISDLLTLVVLRKQTAFIYLIVVKSKLKPK